jgi:hypothetical protein
MLIGISSAYRRAGLMFTKHLEHFGVDVADTLVVRGGTQQFNGTVDDARLVAMRAADPTAAASEWDSEFRDDLTGLFDDAVIDRAVNRERPLELPPQPDVVYKCFVDPSGGASSGDSYSICIGHKDGERLVVDVVRGRQGPFDPMAVTREYTALCKQYRVNSVTGDRYGKQWVQQAWRYCAGYVAAMSDALVATGHACMPADVTVQQAVDVVMKYLRDHPEQRQYSAWYLGRTALSLRFPCN